jgi:hypothetical protein
MSKNYSIITIICMLFCFSCQSNNTGADESKTGQIYIVDQHGEQWNISQAVSLGFDPEKFEYGIGRNAIKPIENPDFSGKSNPGMSNIRVIGISKDKSAQAYSVPRLSYHEIANSEIGGEPIAVGY